MTRLYTFHGLGPLTGRQMLMACAFGILLALAGCMIDAAKAATDSKLLGGFALTATYIGLCKPQLEPQVLRNILTSMEAAIDAGLFTREEAKQAGPIEFAKAQEEGIGPWCARATPGFLQVIKAFGARQ